MLGKTTALEIRTAEGVSFSLPIAGPFSRGFALLVDLAIGAALALFALRVLGMLANALAMVPGIGRVFSDLGTGAYILLQFGVFTCYGMFFEWVWRGQTPGKRLFGLRVVDERGLSLDGKQIVLRNLFRAVDILPSMFYLVGSVSCLLSKRCQRLGDLAAGTLVVREVKTTTPSLAGAALEGTNSFAGMPHLEARLRQNTTPEEARVALDALTRRDDLEPGHRLQVFARIADHFRDIAEFPEELTHGLSDEQYVRNVVETLFRRTKA